MRVICEDCGSIIRIDDFWNLDGRAVCGACAYVEDPEFVDEVLDDGEDDDDGL